MTATPADRGAESADAGAALAPSAGIPPVPAELTEAYGLCARLAAAHYENFPVASRLLPGRMRPHVAAVYAFARGADDLADEGMLAPAERHRQLDEWHTWLKQALAGQVPSAAGHRADLFRAVAHTIAACRLRVDLFEDLLSAFRQDVDRRRYATWSELLDYCRRSANPIGRIVLGIAGYRSARLDLASDELCSALQLTNFWQDLLEDWRRGRLYLPVELTGDADEADLEAGRVSPAWQRALQVAASRTRTMFDAGRAVCDGVRGRLRYELRLTWLGGTTILDRLEAVGYDVARRRPTLGPRDVPLLAARALWWKAARLP